MIHKLIVLCVLLLSGATVYGQVADSATAGTIPISVAGNFSYFDAGYESTKAMGLGAQIDYMPLLSGNLGVEGEGRWLTFGGSNSFSEYNYLGGVRYRFYRSSKYQPFAKFLVGAGEINFPYGVGHGGYLAMAPGGGVDITLKEHWKFRAEYELQYWPGGLGIPGIQTGAMHPNGVTAGFVYKLFRSRYELRQR